MRTRGTGDAFFMRNDDGFDLALVAHGKAAMPEWFHVGFRLDTPDAVRALQAQCEVLASGDFDDFVFFRTRDPDGYQLEIYWERSS